MTLLKTTFLLVLLPAVFELADSMMECNYIQDGAKVGTGYELCPPNVKACVTKINKGSQRYATGCDVGLQCQKGDKKFSDKNYEYRCCYSERCNNGAGALGVSVATVALVIAKFAFF